MTSSSRSVKEMSMTVWSKGSNYNSSRHYRLGRHLSTSFLVAVAVSPKSNGVRLVLISNQWRQTPLITFLPVTNRRRHEEASYRGRCVLCRCWRGRAQFREG